MRRGGAMLDAKPKAEMLLSPLLTPTAGDVEGVLRVVVGRELVSGGVRRPLVACLRSCPPVGTDG